jgi:hypothetical protein
MHGVTQKKICLPRPIVARCVRSHISTTPSPFYLFGVSEALLRVILHVARLLIVNFSCILDMLSLSFIAHDVSNWRTPGCSPATRLTLHLRNADWGD